MYKEQDLVSLMLVQRARQGKKLFTGQLYSPSDIGKISQERGYLLQPGWYLGGQMHPAMFQQATRSPEFTQSAAVFRSNGGFLYAYFAQQLGDWQHRFLVQLIGDQAGQLVEQCKEGGICFTLADCDGPMATVVAAPPDMATGLSDGVQVDPVPLDSDGLWRAMSDCMTTAALLLSPHDCPCPDDAADVRQVCVSVIQGSDLRTQAALSVCGQAGPRPH